MTDPKPMRPHRFMSPAGNAGEYTITAAEVAWINAAIERDANLAQTNLTGFDLLRRANVERDVHWDPSQKITLLFRSNELAGETGELANVVKKIEREALGLRGSRATRTELRDELADVIISADLLAMTAKIDLWAAVVRKFNATSEKNGLPTRLPENVP